MLTPGEIQVINAERRARSHTLTPGDRHKMLSKRNGKAMARRNTPCAESIAMKCPLHLSSDTTYLGTVTNESPDVEASASPHASSLADRLNYTTETDGN